MRTSVILSLLVLLCTAVILQAADGSSIVCLKCNYTNEARYKYCTKCGATLPKPGIPVAPVVEQGSTHAPQEAVLEVGMSRLFHLRDKNVISGKILELRGDSIAIIETVDGKLKIQARDILAEIVEISKIDETQYSGPLLSEDEYSVSLKTPYGVVVVLKKDIQKMDRYFGDTKVSWQEERQRFFTGEELTSIFLDPTATPLPAYSFYVSGFSLGYGFTEDFTLTTRFGSNFSGDLNLEPHLRLYHRAIGSTDLSLALGLRLFSDHKSLNEAEKYSHWIINKNTNVRRDDYSKEEIIEKGIETKNILVDPDEKTFHWATYAVLTRRASLANGRGKWGIHLGVETNGLSAKKPELKSNPNDPNNSWIWDKNFTIPYRIWGAWDYDLSKRIKFMMEIFADNGYEALTLSQARRTYFDDTPFTLDSGEGTYKPVDFDFGFLWTMSETFRVGFHWQSPYLAFYWRW